MDHRRASALPYKNSDLAVDSADESISDEENGAAAAAAEAAAPRSHFDSTATSAVGENQSSRCGNLERERSGDEACSWSAILEEADELVRRSHGSSDLSDSRKSRKGGRGKSKLKFSIRSLSHKEEVPWISDTIEGRVGLEQIPIENSMVNLLGNLQEETDEPSTNLVSYEQIGAVPSVSELLEDLQENNIATKGTLSLLTNNVKAKERKIQLTGKRPLSSLGSRTLDGEDPPEFMDNGMSSEGEDIGQNNLSCTTKRVKQQTMTDLFQEAFSTFTVEEPLLPISKRARTGFHGRLQQILQTEKDRHLEFCKKIQTGCNPYDDLRCIDVRILSRSLEAKLTVCRCLIDESAKTHEDRKAPQSYSDDGRTTEGKIIFSSKVCDNVELGVGNLVRIHPPWREIQVCEDEKIILCMYFSQIIM